jgi:hypothetical protein
VSKSYKFGSITFGRGSELEGYVDRVVRELLPETRQALLEEVKELGEYAEQNWPVLKEKDPAMVARLKRSIERGKLKGQDLNLVSRNSRGKWRYGVRMTPDGLEGFVENKAPYSAFVTFPRKRGEKRPKRVFQVVLMRRFGAKRQNALFRRIQKELG